MRLSGAPTRFPPSTKKLAGGRTALGRHDEARFLPTPGGPATLADVAISLYFAACGKASVFCATLLHMLVICPKCGWRGVPTYVRDEDGNHVAVLTCPRPHCKSAVVAEVAK